MTDEVEKLKQAAVEAAEGERQIQGQIDEAVRIAVDIVRGLPEHAGMAAAALVAAYVMVAKGAEHCERGSGRNLLGIAIHQLMGEAMDMMGDGHA